MLMEELEELRSKATRLYWISLALGIIGLLLLYNHQVLGLVLTPIALFILLVIVKKKKAEYTKAFKQTIVTEALNKKFTEVSYQPNLGMQEAETMLGGLFSSGNRYSSNDWLEAKYKGIKFRQADISVENEQRDGDGGNSRICIFKGRFMILDLDKRIPHSVQVYGKKFRNPRRNSKGKGSLFEHISSSISKDIWEQVELESVEFNGKFNVFSPDPHSVFYILTPQVMEAINKLYKKYNGEIALCFLGKRIYVGIHSDIDAFEVEFRSADDFEFEKQKVKKEIKVITDFIDIMKQEEILFTKIEDEYEY